MTCDRERKDARRLDRMRCERFDNPVRPPADAVLAMYASSTIERIADAYGVPYGTAAAWTRAARDGYKYRNRYARRSE